MKSQLITLVSIIIHILYSILTIKAGIIPVSRTFNTSDISYTITKIENTDYIATQWGTEMINSGETGAPSLPKEWLSFAIPVDATNIQIDNISFSNECIQQLSNAILPVQEPTPSDGRALIKTHPNPDYYTKAHFMPIDLVRITGIENYKDICKIVTIEISPMCYNPFERKTKAYGNISFTLLYDEDTNFTSQSNRPISKEDINVIQHIVNNPEFISSPAKISTGAAVQKPIVKEGNGVNIHNHLDAFEYSIITPKEFAPYFERLIALKKLQGLDAGVVCIEDILESPLVANGDTISNINDDAGKLRQYLNLAQNIVQYAFLVGKPPKMPIRYGCYRDFNIAVTEPAHKETLIPTDIYFSEFKNNWNQDGDAYYGELKDGFDYISDIYVGRLLCSTPDDIINYIDKVEQYELNPGNGDLAYLENAYLYFSLDSENSDEKNSILNPIAQFHKNQDIRTEPNSIKNGSELVTDINQRQYGFWDLHCHGAPEGVRLRKYQPYYGLSALDNEQNAYEQESGNGLDNINNFFYPNYTYSMSCTTMPFDAPGIEEYKGYVPNSDNLSKNFGESFTTGRHYGGVAFLGNTREGYWRYSSLLEEKFFIALNNTKVTHAEIGKSESIARSSSVSSFLNGYPWGHHIRLTHNILGDPQIRIWRNKPMKDFIDIDGILRMSNVIEVRDSISCNQPGLEYKIVAREPSGKIHIFPKTSAHTTLTDVSPYSILSIVGDNMITYPADMQLQNFRTSKSDYIYAKSAHIGRYIDPSLQTGDVVFEGNGMTYTIDAKDFVNLKGRIIVRDFATLRIITPSFVSLGDVIVSSGGKIEVYAKGYLLGRDTQFLCDNAFFAYKYNKYNSSVKEPLEYGMAPILPNTQKAQRDKYFPMFEISKEWKYQLHWKSSPRAADQECLTRTLRVDETTEINGKTYFVVNSYTNGALTPDDNEPYGYFREDSDNHRVYFLPNKNYKPTPVIYHNVYDFQLYDDEICLYDFNPEAVCKRGYATFSLPAVSRHLNGFTYAFETNIAESYAQGIGYVVTDSKGHPKPHEACDLLGRPSMVGSTYGYLPWLYSIVDGKGNEIFAINENRPTNIRPSLPDNAIPKNITIDYIGGSIIIESDKEIGVVDILNVQGLAISHHIVRENSVSIPVNTIPSGLYLVKAGTATKTFTVR